MITDYLIISYLSNQWDIFFNFISPGFISISMSLCTADRSFDFSKSRVLAPLLPIIKLMGNLIKQTVGYVETDGGKKIDRLLAYIRCV